MTQKDIIAFFQNYKRGTYTAITKQTTKNGYKKICCMVCRFVNYYNIKQVKDATRNDTKKRDYEIQIIPHILKLNTNTNNLLLCVYATNNARQHAKNQYFYNDAAITEAEYYSGINEKKREYDKPVLFNFKIADIISLGGQKNL